MIAPSSNLKLGMALLTGLTLLAGCAPTPVTRTTTTTEQITTTPPVIPPPVQSTTTTESIRQP